MQIKDSYVAYCVDETSYYVLIKHRERTKEQKEFEESMSRHSIKKRK